MSMFLWVAVLLSATILPAGSPQTTRAQVDLVELNHFLDDGGREVFVQLVFFDWCADQKCFHVRAWRLVKHPSQLPRRQWDPAGYLIRWQDKAITREVWAKSMRETWTQEDPERVNRATLPENERRPLWTAPPKLADANATRAAR